MKKLLLILSAVFVSAITYGASLNPYAYNLSSTWNEETQELTVRFTLNAHPNMQKNPDGTTNPDGGQTSGQGIQIFAVDPDTKEQYYIYGIPGSYINERKLANSYDYEYTIPIDGMSKDADVSKRRPLPAGKNLTWAVVVQGKNRTDQSEPVVVNDNIDNRPYSPHGIAVNNDQNSPDFGSIYVTECTDGVSGNATWGWLASSKGRSLLKYDPALKFQTSYRKHKDGDPNSELFSLRTNTLLEPHRVRISDDGRIFVSSYNKNTSSGKPLVWELNKTTGKFTPIIYNNTSYGHRVYGMDVKGSGSGIKILLCILLESTSNSSSEFRVYEYSLNSLGNDKNTGTKLFRYLPGATNQGYLTECISHPYFHYTDGLANVRYGSADRSDIFFGLDLFYNKSVKTALVYYQSGAYGDPKYFNRTGDGHYYGGAGFIPYVDKNIKTERVAMGRCYQGTGSENDGRIQVYEIDDIKNSNHTATPAYTKTTNTRYIVNDIAIDCAHNIYAVSFTDGTTGNGTGRLIAIAMPYDGKTTTIAPATNANENKYFNIKPVPNILATDLTYAPYGNENKYEFSFNVNTKPELAQIRFYKSETDMLANNDNYSFYYEFSETKQGRMSVIFDAVGGGTIDGYKQLLNDTDGNTRLNLPRGEYYWNVYVKTRKSCAFAPIYTQKLSDFNVDQGDYSNDPHRQHATVDNNPNNKGFGHIYVADHHNIAESANRKHYVRAYTIGDATGNAKLDDQNNINDNTRYTTYWQVKSNNKVRFTRRPVVSPDGMVYIADEGTNQKTAQPNWFTDPDISTYGFEGAGLHVLDPSKQTDNANAVWEAANFSIPHETTGNQEVTTGAYFLYKDGGWKLYRTNTYDEFTLHPAKDGVANNYQNSKWNTNGYRVYNLTSNVHSDYEDNSTTKVPFGAGDANGQFSIVATKNGVWMCQHRSLSVANAPTTESGTKQLPDNAENILLSFFDHSGVRKFTSLTYDGGSLTQNETSPFQSAPGAGMAYQERGGKEYLYVVNHDGHILEFEIKNGATTPSLTLTQKYPLGTGNKGEHGAVSSMNFDYAGNLVVTAGQTYGTSAYTQVGTRTLIERDHQELVIYTMPYPNQENARAIPASEAFRLLPERASYLSMEVAEVEYLIKPYIEETRQCALDFFRPLQGGMFNTICLPFDLNLSNLPAGHPYKNASVKAFTGLNVTTIGNEKVLELVFTDVENRQMWAGVPYLFKTEDDISGIVSFDDPIQFSVTEGSTVKKPENNSSESVTFQGIIASQMINASPNHLIVVANNRLAEVSTRSNMFGFRGYFILNNISPAQQVNAQLSFKRPVATAVGNAYAEGIDIEKFIREGRIYIRIDDQVYDLTGARVQ